MRKCAACVCVVMFVTFSAPSSLFEKEGAMIRLFFAQWTVLSFNSSHWFTSSAI